MDQHVQRYATILLVEDNPDHALLAKLSLSRLDEVREVRIAVDGLHALDMLQGGFSPDILLLDLQMPRLDGFGVLKRLREHPRFKNLPVVVLTTSIIRADLTRSRDLGAMGYLVKPLDGNSLRAFMKRMADKRSREGSRQQELPF